jgi:feruloyl esterase
MWSGLIHEAVLEQCDELDGVKDGIIEYPDLCQFDPSVLKCASGVTENCLSASQVDVVRKFFKPLTYNDGTMIYPGMQVGTEKLAVKGLYAGKPFATSLDWFRYVVHSDLDWDPMSFTAEKDARASDFSNPFDIRTFPDHLEPFQSHGGKIITYHGMQDQQITGHITAKWYDHMLKSHSHSELDDFLRYFRISGLYHCNSGPGAWMIGQTQSGITPLRNQDIPSESTHNVLRAIVDWVENGKSPDTLEGTKYFNDDISGPVAFTRKHCR